jgi:transcriptional regulator with XRE-family HTH domain
MHFRLGVNPQHVTEWKKGRSNPSAETTLAIMGIAEERTEGARTALGHGINTAADL